MAHSPIFARLIHALRVAKHCDANGLSTDDGLAEVARLREQRLSRRGFLKGTAAAGALAATGPLLLPRRARAYGWAPNVDVGIVGAGLGGLVCADTLREAGIAATLYDAANRVGGRQWSMGGVHGGPVSFPGQVVERGGELIDTTHKTLLGYANEFNLVTEDYPKHWLDGETAWYFDGEHVSEAAVVDEWRQFVDLVRADIADLSGEVTANYFTDFDRQLDYTNIRQYLEQKGAGRIISKAIDVSYNIEYGREIDEQSILNLFFFIHIDKRSRFQPFGVFSDERYHVVGGNELIAKNIRNRLPGAVEVGSRLLAARKKSDGRVELTFDVGGTTVVKTHEAVVFALPFSALRKVELDSSLGLPTEKLRAIHELRYGTNAKLNVGFDSRFWGEHGSKGDSYSDLANHQSTWEVNPVNAGNGHAVLLDYSGGLRGASLDPRRTDREVERWLTDLDTIWPGAKDRVVKTGRNRYLAHLEHWPSNPNIEGSYTCNHPGYFTTIEGHSGTPVGNLYFAGEHTDPFYEWQGFMEGAANTGIRAANELLWDFR